jgi:hypothetical protein
MGCTVVSSCSTASHKYYDKEATGELSNTAPAPDSQDKCLAVRAILQTVGTIAILAFTTGTKRVLLFLVHSEYLSRWSLTSRLVAVISTLYNL